MTQRALDTKIARENARLHESLLSGVDPADLPVNAFAFGWAEAYTHAPDVPARKGWVARFEAGQRARIEADLADAS